MHQLCWKMDYRLFLQSLDRYECKLTLIAHLCTKMHQGVKSATSVAGMLEGSGPRCREFIKKCSSKV